MTQEDKQLLLRDICARLPYGVKVQSYNYEEDVETIETLLEIDSYGYISTLECDTLKNIYKPYLFPLSSMTGEQCYKLYSIRSEFQDCWKYIKTPIPLSICNFEQIDWFHKNHIDYRGLIPMDLATDATELNIY